MPLFRWFFHQILFDNLTLDIDSTVVTRYGDQDGAYNPNKPGRSSHHPLMAIIPEIRMIANTWMRQGNTGAARNDILFLDET
jgi:hypothetical protein